MNWRPILWHLGAAAALVVLAFALRYAREAGLVSGESGRRTVQAVIGVGLAVYGNFMPKILDSVSASLRAAAFHQAIARVGGWSMTLAGLLYAGLWAFAPLGFADVASMVVVMAALAIMLAYAVWAIATCRRTKGPAAS